MRLIIIIFVLALGLTSCKYYEKSTVTNYWIDKWNYKHTVWKIERFSKKNDSLVMLRIDTVITDLNPPNQSTIIDWNK